MGDISRTDKSIINKTEVFHIDEQGKGSWVETRWKQLKAGQMVKITKDSECPADCVLLYSTDEKGVVYVDTMNLDGETNLKEKTAPKETYDIRDEMIPRLCGSIT